MERLMAALSLTLMFFVLALARDPGQLKADFLSIMPTGKTEIRMAWIKGNRPPPEGFSQSSPT